MQTNEIENHIDASVTSYLEEGDIYEQATYLHEAIQILREASAPDEVIHAVVPAYCLTVDLVEPLEIE